MGKKYKVVLDRVACIGAAPCAAVTPDFWEMQDDGKVSIVNAQKEGDNEFIIIDEADFEKNKMAAEVCPVSVIKIYDEETGEQVI